ncbi:hypothetical protein SDRG_05625 [Saprolegnia diclina VS20]|uniref:Thioredoxin domain-containing protein n=1 Tax=Saprolegnia diclina (strain VS20) TaxID=1156394 RepID=T0S203_SAPDV|nr:hypothetical protein SDRG_05625 [Saprolegnia diclina VS20]EQC36792.1 hypothetical protein SDRG_05625 [Saprolegnia diclina VS20]|eukprot:XP_008609573.1 hypothetical protein SDRG_05625 [Saprolegnia diclina VS20]
MAATLVDLVGPTLVRNGAPRTDVVVDQVAYEATYEWRHVCDMCGSQIIGARYACDQDANYDVCRACHAAASTPERTFTEAPIPSKPVPRTKETVATASALHGKTVLLYLGALACESCRAFTPYLADYYTRLQSQLALEIVYVSGDSDDATAHDAFDAMPWLALPFLDTARKAALAQRYHVHGTPTLIVLDPTGATINANVQDKVWVDPQGLSFPYAPKTLEEMLGTDVVDQDGHTEALELESMLHKTLVLYFAAATAKAPTDDFTTHLAATCAANRLVDVLYVSADDTREEYDAMVASMPWRALPYDVAASALTELADAFNVESLPAALVLGPGPDRALINKDAIGAIASGSSFPWPAHSVVDLRFGPSANGYGLNSKPTLVTFCDKLEADALAAHKAEMSVLAAEARPHHAACSDHGCSHDTDGPSMLYFVSSTTDDWLRAKVHDMANLDDDACDQPHAILLDMHQRRLLVHHGLDGASLRDVVAAFHNHTLEMQPMHLD